MKNILTICLALMLSFLSDAQTIKKYSGNMSKPEWIAELICYGDYNFKGSYSYYEDSEEKRILHGNFKVSYNKFDGIGNIIGNYKNGIRNGHWTIKKSRKGKNCSDYCYDFFYKDDKLDGVFTFRDGDYGMVGKFVNGILSDSIQLIKYTYGFDFYTGSVSYNGGRSVLKGKVNNQGLPHGVWVEEPYYEHGVPTEKTRLYYDGCLVYRRLKDLSSGKTTYTYHISNKIQVPSDLKKIKDTIIGGINYIDVGGVICAIDELTYITERYDDNDSIYYVEEVDWGFDQLKDYIDGNSTLFDEICPAIKNWYVEFDTNAYKEKQREIERQEYEKKRKEEQKKREIMDAYEWGGQLKNMAKHCWGNEAFKEFERFYREGGEKKVKEESEKIIRYEYENYTIGELAEKTKNNQIRETINRKCNEETKKKPLTWLFSTYDRYLESARSVKVFEAFLWL